MRKTRKATSEKIRTKFRTITNLQEEATTPSTTVDNHLPTCWLEIGYTRSSLTFQINPKSLIPLLCLPLLQQLRRPCSRLRPLCSKDPIVRYEILFKYLLQIVDTFNSQVAHGQWNGMTQSQQSMQSTYQSLLRIQQHKFSEIVCRKEALMAEMYLGDRDLHSDAKRFGALINEMATEVQQLAFLNSALQKSKNSKYQ